jgi:hypothetical protein
MDATEKLLDVWEAAEILGYTPRRLKRLARLGQVPHFRLPAGRAQGNEYRFRESELMPWVESLRQEVPSHA